jgi:hypothetical protein
MRVVQAFRPAIDADLEIRTTDEPKLHKLDA